MSAMCKPTLVSPVAEKDDSAGTRLTDILFKVWQARSLATLVRDTTSDLRKDAPCPDGVPGTVIVLDALLGAIWSELDVAASMVSAREGGQ